MKLRNKMAASGLAPLGHIALLALATVVSLTSLHRTNSKVNHAIDVIQSAGEIEKLVADMAADHEWFLITGKAKDLGVHVDAHEEVVRRTQLLRVMTSDSKQIARLNVVDASLRRWISEDLASQTAESKHVSDSERLATRLATIESRRGKTLVEEVREELAQFIACERDLLRERQSIADSTVQNTRGVIIWGSVAIAPFILFLSLFLASNTTRRLNTLLADVKRVAGGDLTVVISTSGHDEISELAAGFNEMVEAVVAAQERAKYDEEEKRRLQKMESIGQLAAGIAHEINTPTQYVGDNTRFLRSAFDDMEPVLAKAQELAAASENGQEQVEDTVEELRIAIAIADIEYLREEIPSAIDGALEGVSRVSKIVRAMNEFAHPGEETKLLTDLNHAIENTVTLATNEWRYVAEVETDLDPRLPLVPVLAGGFKQVLLNLIVNAAHAVAEVVGEDGESRGTIRISTIRVGDWAEIRVADSGAGIPEHVRERIFDPFFTTKGLGKGSGQGLSIAHSVVVNQHGGTFSFETEMGKGSTFLIRLPLASADTDVPGTSATGPDVLLQGTV